MKWIIIAGFAIIIMIFGCDIEGKIDDASMRCEDKISELLEGAEDICLTKEEILELITSVQGLEDTGNLNETNYEEE